MKKEEFVRKHLEGKGTGIVPKDERAEFLQDLLAICEESAQEVQEKEDPQKEKLNPYSDHLLIF